MAPSEQYSGYKIVFEEGEVVSLHEVMVAARGHSVMNAGRFIAQFPGQRDELALTQDQLVERLNCMRH